MKKILNMTFALVISMLMIVGISNVKATDLDSSITMSHYGFALNDGVSNTSGTPGNLNIQGAQFAYKKAGNYIAFCAGDRKSNATDGVYALTSFSTNDDKINAGLAAIIEKGLEGKYLVSENPSSNLDRMKKVYVTQAAIWKYLENKGVINNVDIDYTITQIKSTWGSTYGSIDELLSAASAAEKLPGGTTIAATNLAFEKDGDVYKATVTISGTNLDINTVFVNKEVAPEGTTVTKSGNTYVVEVPVASVTDTSKEVKIKFTGKSNVYKVAGYYKNSSSPQELTTSKLGDKQETVTTEVTGIIGTTKVVIKKTDVATGKLLKGATLQILDSDKNKLYEWKSEDTEYAVYLDDGTYYLKEISSPDGYALNEEMVKFEIDGSKPTVTVEMKNEHVVEVPNTLSTSSAILLALAMIDVAVGIGLFIYVKKNKVTE